MRSWTRRASILAAALALTAVGATTAAANTTITTDWPAVANGIGIDCSGGLDDKSEVECSNILALANHGQTFHVDELIPGGVRSGFDLILE